MAQTFIPGWLYGVLRSTAQGNVFENTFSLSTTPNLHPTGGDLETLAADWWSVVGLSIQSFTSTDVTFLSITIRDLNDVTGAEGTYTLPVNTNGLLASQSVPYNAAAVISWRSAQVGRRGRGRWYALGIGETQVAGNILGAPMQTLLLAAGVVINSYTGTGAVPSTPVIASRAAEVLYPIAAVVVDTFVDSMRRRLQGRGA